MFNLTQNMSCVPRVEEASPLPVHSRTFFCGWGKSMPLPRVHRVII